MLPKTQEFIFDMMLEPVLQAVKDANQDGAKCLPVLQCPEQYLHDFCEYLRLPKNRKIFREAKFFPIIQTIEARHEEENQNIFKGFVTSLMLVCLIRKDNPHISPSYLNGLRLEVGEILNRYTQTEIISFIDRYLGFMVKNSDGKINWADFN
ncbi:hypothetical protein NG798_23400 [Ancylothrix sp. C2]|uniref:hypothetical protein n=1 Tax=Ancylothrix sp. D3o TaxID=2953691 RepID=UPI0021BAB156|nr:hypothetical protein [Ancylothrix sp. D3o]MCT7952751.1 hypothetical protein [Ancylothrix sp. D3o]